MFTKMVGISFTIVYIWAIGAYLYIIWKKKRHLKALDKKETKKG